MQAVNAKGLAEQNVMVLVTMNVTIDVITLAKIHVPTPVEVHAKKIALQDVDQLAKAVALAVAIPVALANNTYLLFTPTLSRYEQ